MRQNNQEKIRIMGIDPGSQVTGIGIVDLWHGGKIDVFDFSVIKTARNRPLHLRLADIYQGLKQKIVESNPDVVAVEDIFYADNIKTAIVMGQTRGVALLAPVNLGIQVAEYSPREVKMAVVGNGAASKVQVQFMVKKILNIDKEIPQDAADALAVAICFVNRNSGNL